MKKSLTGRWLLATLSVTATILLIFLSVIFIMTRTAYYRSAESSLYTRARSTAELLSVYVSDLTVDFGSAGREFVEQFKDKSMMELQILSVNGEIVFSSAGFLPSEEIAAEFPLTTERGSNQRGLFRGKNASGEHVMALSIPVWDVSGNLLGGVRCVASMQQVDKQIWLILLLLLSVSGIILLAVFLFIVFLVRSVVEPLREVGTAARRMALGDYEYRIVKRRNDEIGELSDTINYMASEISRGEKMKNEFISSVSHELRTPLTAIKGWSETLQYSGTSDEEMLQKGLEVIAGESERLNGLVEQLLDFSRIQSDRITLKKERVDLSAELENIVFLMRDRAVREGVSLEYVKTASLPTVYGDAARLRQVFVNLIDNAVKYSGSGGRIRVEAARIGQNVQIVVSDTGVGIAAEDLPRVRERFFRVNHNRPGSGIGLAVVDEIVCAHRGVMSIESTPGVGTTVTVTLPLRPSEKLPTQR